MNYIRAIIFYAHSQYVRMFIRKICKRKKFAHLMAIFFITITLLAAKFPYWATMDKKGIGESSRAEIQASMAQSNPTTTILFWTTFFGKPSIYEMQINVDSCPTYNCQLIEDRSKVNESDIIFFHISYTDKLEPLPTYRRPDQRYVMMTFESPVSLGVGRKLLKNIPPHFFNWTATYRFDSDLFGKSVYVGEFQEKPNSISRNSEHPQLDDYFGVNITSKSKSIAWFASNCETPINREGYIAELQKHIPVDVYGECLSNPKSCPEDESDKCNTMLSRDYFFYLSFENSFCPDYVTEKFPRGFQTGTVPVVFGGANYSLFAPDHSYINARDFETPKLLAEYLTNLTLDRHLYSRYFDWKRDLKYYEQADLWCTICEMFHDSTYPKKSYANIDKWWYEDRPCENFHWSHPVSLPRPRKLRIKMNKK